MLLFLGFGLSVIGAVFFAIVYSCSANPGSCTTTSTNLTTYIGTGILLIVFGGYLIITGAIFTATGHLAIHLRPAGPETQSTPTTRIRLCLKCGHQVESSAYFCPNCGNPLTKPSASNP